MVERHDSRNFFVALATQWHCVYPFVFEFIMGWKTISVWWTCLKLFAHLPADRLWRKRVVLISAACGRIFYCWNRWVGDVSLPYVFGLVCCFVDVIKSESGVWCSRERIKEGVDFEGKLCSLGGPPIG